MRQPLNSINKSLGFIFLISFALLILFKVNNFQSKDIPLYNVSPSSAFGTTEATAKLVVYKHAVKEQTPNKKNLKRKFKKIKKQLKDELRTLKNED